MRAHVLLLASAILVIVYHASGNPLEPFKASTFKIDLLNLAEEDFQLRKAYVEPIADVSAPIIPVKSKRSPQLLTRKRYLRKGPPSDSNGTLVPNQLTEYEFNVFRSDDLQTQGLL